MKNGREYARVDEVKSGDTLEMGGGFYCLKEGSNHIVRSFNAALYVTCGQGKHFLDGQLSSDGTHYIGMYKAAK